MTGDLELDIRQLDQLAKKTQEQSAQMRDALYEIWKAGYELSVSCHYDGDSAKAFKKYMTNGPLQAISELMDISSELDVFAALLDEGFKGYESNDSGVIAQNQLDSIKQDTSRFDRDFQDFKPNLNSTLSKAGEYITVEYPDYFAIDNAYDQMVKKLDDISLGLSEADTEASRIVDELYARIQDTSKWIGQIFDNSYKNGTPLFSNMEKIASNEWNRKGSNVTLLTKLYEDPFAYREGHVSIAEDQWATGLADDIYAFAGFSFMGASGSVTRKGNSFLAKGKGSVFEANAYAQLTDYIKAEADSKLLFGEGEIGFGGLGEDTVGFHMHGGVGVFMAEAKATIGVDDFNGHAKAGVKLGCASGDVASEFDIKDGTFKLGVKGEAYAAEAHASAGLDVFNYDIEKRNKETGKMEEVSAFGINVGANAKVGGSAGVWLESNSIIETKYFNVNSLDVNVDLGLLIGVNVDLKIPYVYNKPWNWW